LRARCAPHTTTSCSARSGCARRAAATVTQNDVQRTASRWRDTAARVAKKKKKNQIRNLRALCVHLLNSRISFAHRNAHLARKHRSISCAGEPAAAASSVAYALSYRTSWRAVVRRAHRCAAERRGGVARNRAVSLWRKRAHLCVTGVIVTHILTSQTSCIAAKRIRGAARTASHRVTSSCHVMAGGSRYGVTRNLAAAPANISAVAS